MNIFRKQILNVLLVCMRASIMFFYTQKFAIKLLKSNIVENMRLTNKLNSIVSNKKKFKVYEIVMPGVFYAFTIGGKSIYITTDYLKFLSKDEQISILLHEVGHLVKQHSLKTIVTLYPLNLLYIYFGIIVGTEPIIWGIIFTILLIFVTGIFYTRIIKRKYESDADIYVTKFGYGVNFISTLEKGEIVRKRADLKNKNVLFYKIRDKYRYYVGCYLPTEKRIAKILDGHKDFVSAKKHSSKKR